MKHTFDHIDESHTQNLSPPFTPSPHLQALLEVITRGGGKALLVGGSVRDHLRGLKPTDIDLEVYRLPSDQLEALLSAEFVVKAVGKAFGIFKVMVDRNGHVMTFDVSLPRLENKSGQGHRGFVITCDPHMSFAKAARRRDFTINAMAIDIEHQTLIDPYGGAKHLQQHKLRHVSEAFSEDPLRVLRAAQFCARFDLELDPETRDLCVSLKDELATLSRERIFWEMKKLLLAQKPSKGLEVLRATEALILFPELAHLIGCAQEPKWHPEGDVWIHTLMVVDQAAKLTEALEEEMRLIVVAGALCHDFGKPCTTVVIDGVIKSPGHEQQGVEPTLEFLKNAGFPSHLAPAISSLVSEHLKPYQLYNKRDEVSDGAIARLSCRVDIDLLLLVSQADFLGRTTAEAKSGFDPSAPWLKARVDAILGQEKQPKPLMLGRHLLLLGQKPGPIFTEILGIAFEAQLDGKFATEEDGFQWLTNYLKRK